MTDIALAWDGQQADVVLRDGDLALDDGLGTSAIISLFSDRLARADDRLPGDSSDRRGWPGDSWADVPGDRIGARLWLLDREKQLAETLRRAREYGRESLSWAVEDGIASRIEVTASVPSKGVMRLDVAVYRRNGRIENHQFDTLWGDV